MCPCMYACIYVECEIGRILVYTPHLHRLDLSVSVSHSLSLAMCVKIQIVMLHASGPQHRPHKGLGPHPLPDGGVMNYSKRPSVPVLLPRSGRRAVALFASNCTRCPHVAAEIRDGHARTLRTAFTRRTRFGSGFGSGIHSQYPIKL